MTQELDARDPIELLADEYALRWRRGESPTIAEYEARYPDQAAQIHEIFPPIEMLERLKRARVSSHSRVAPPDPQPRLERLGDFRIVREVGRGGMGIVYEAEQLSLGRRVALKVLPRSALLETDRLARFEREARAAARLHHTHIVPVFEVGEHDGLHYYVMQYIDGESLQQRLETWRESAPPSSAEHFRTAARWIREIADALDYAHRHATLHRDVKPANVMIDRAGQAWITDFGLAKLAEPTPLTATGSVVGTLKYLAPECLDGAADARSDIYSLGMTLYELVTLAPPYGDSGPAELLRHVCEVEPVAPSKLAPHLPRDLETVLLKAIARAPAQRYQDAGALARDLDRFLEDRPVNARRMTIAERAIRWCRRNRALAAASSVAICALIGAAAIGWVGYAETQRALAGESQKSLAAAQATARAEANVALSLNALVEIFDALSSEDSGALPPGPARRATETANSIDVLESVLRFFENFAEQNATQPRLEDEAARAYARVADIRRRLGQTAESEAALSQAIEIRSQLAAREPLHARPLAELAEVCATPFAPTGDHALLERIEARLRRALDCDNQLLQLEPAQPESRAAHARHECSMATLSLAVGRDGDAQLCYERAIAALDGLAPVEQRAHVVIIEQVRTGLAYGELLLRIAETSRARELVEDAAKTGQRWIETHAPGHARPSRGQLPLFGALIELNELRARIYDALGETSLVGEARRAARALENRLGPPPRGSPPPRGDARPVRRP
ncbi:MAG: protein kinase domain-containing protein [Planctomycetota bacterium]